VLADSGTESTALQNVLRSVDVLSLALFLRKQTRGSMVHTWSSVRPEHDRQDASCVAVI